MPLLYCSQHERLFAEKKNGWVDCSLDEIHYLEDLSEESINTVNSDIQVVETSCDWCKKINRKPSFFFFILLLFVYLTIVWQKFTEESSCCPLATPVHISMWSKGS